MLVKQPSLPLKLFCKEMAYWLIKDDFKTGPTGFPLSPVNSPQQRIHKSNGGYQNSGRRPPYRSTERYFFVVQIFSFKPGIQTIIISLENQRSLIFRTSPYGDLVGEKICNGGIWIGSRGNIEKILSANTNGAMPDK
jgi:hypothetical protein